MNSIIDKTNPILYYNEWENRIAIEFLRIIKYIKENKDNPSFIEFVFEYSSMCYDKWKKRLLYEYIDNHIYLRESFETDHYVNFFEHCINRFVQNNLHIFLPMKKKHLSELARQISSLSKVNDLQKISDRSIC